MAKIRRTILPGLAMEDVEAFMKRPAQIVSPPPRKSYLTSTIHEIPVGTELHVWSQDGIPYYTTYVIVHTQKQLVVRSTVENLRW